MPESDLSKLRIERGGAAAAADAPRLRRRRAARLSIVDALRAV